MNANLKYLGYAVIIIGLLAVAAFLWRGQLGGAKPAPSGPGYVSDWFACKAHPGWLCAEDGQMKPDPNWKGPREEDPRKPKPKLPPGPEGR